MELFSVSKAIKEAFSKSRKLREGLLKAYWYKVVDRLAERTIPLYIKDGTLFIGVEDSLYLHHMSMNKGRYILKIRELLKSDEVKDIRFKITEIKIVDYGDNSDIELEEIETDRQKNFNSKIENLSLEEKIAYLKEISMEREKKLLEKGYKKCTLCGRLYLGAEDRCIICCANKRLILEEKDDNK